MKYSDFVLALTEAETATGAAMPLVFGSGDSKQIDPEDLFRLVLNELVSDTSMHLYVPLNGSYQFDFGNLIGASGGCVINKDVFQFYGESGSQVSLGNLGAGNVVNFGGFTSFIFDTLSFTDATGYYLTYDPNTGEIGFAEDL